MSTVTTSTGRGRLPVTRRDRRPALAALALLLILGGALGSALVAFRSGDRVDVLVARDDIPVGKLIERSDLSVARVAADGANVVDAAFVDRFVGTVATGRIPAGTLVHPDMFKVGDVVPRGAELVGVVVDPTRRTTLRPREGDVVRVYFVTGGAGAGESGAAWAPGDTVVEAARVVQVGNGSAAQGLSLTLLVPGDVAGELADLAAAGSVAVTELPDDTRPLVDTEFE